MLLDLGVSIQDMIQVWTALDIHRRLGTNFHRR